ncbi:MAG: aminopeptidase P N-terminal domain-containing protein, partial [Spirochaetota bacterium]
DSLALIAGAGKNPTHDVLRQYNDFYYLSGAEVPHSYLLLDGKNRKTTIFLPHRSEKQRDKEGEILCAELAETCARLTGIDEVLGIEELAQRLEGCTRLYTPFRQGECGEQSWDTLQRARQETYSDPWDGRLDRIDHFLLLLRERCSRAEIRDLGPVLDDLRLIKDDCEIALLRRAGSLSAAGLIEAMRSTRPGIREYQLDAVMRYRYLVNGARGASYKSIVAGGKNAWYGHYEANRDLLADGDLVLVDAGPEYHYYTSDATRMWPVNGKYSPVQRELYGFILEYHKALLGCLRAGRSDMEVREEASGIMAKVVAKTRFSKGIYEAAAKRSLDFPHLTHSVGLAVHDVGHYRGGIMREGLVFALDPQLIIPEERLYIRVEDTVLVTKEGVENLSAEAPLELDEVERTMREEGMLSRYPAWIRPG